MTARMEHRASFAAPAEKVFATLVDETFLTARLERLGGKDAALTGRSVDGERATITLRQGIDAQHLPSVARALLNGDLVVTREERWRREGDGYVADTAASVSGVPGRISGTMRLAGGDAAPTVLSTVAEVTVSIPFVGGKVESAVAEQITRLVAAEAEFATDWLAEHA